jgi:organic hydroperoxide reductase OsmC/OhrA
MINLLFVRPLAISHDHSPHASAAITHDASQALFMDAAVAARANCPIARLLKANISMIASLDV